MTRRHPVHRSPFPKGHFSNLSENVSFARLTGTKSLPPDPFSFFHFPSSVQSLTSPPFLLSLRHLTLTPSLSPLSPVSLSSDPPTVSLSRPRKVFFTDYGHAPKVERCDMDGQNRTKLVDTKIVFPHGVTLDLVNKLVYWADAYLDYIEVVDYEGKNRHTIIQRSEERRVGKECLRLCRSRWSPYH